MIADEIRIEYIGGATAVFEVAGLRFLTDPTFDPLDTKYPTTIYVLRKTKQPLKTVEDIGKIDFVLLSHDHHFDNLDNSGRRFLAGVDKVFTTVVGAKRLGSNCIGLENWESAEVNTRDGRILRITGTPCRHGPVDGDRGPVTGFLLNFLEEKEGTVYITGDTVWYEGIVEVAKRFNINMVVLFFGAAVVKEVGPAHLTMTVDEAIKVAELFDNSTIVPLHFEGWEHFTESASQIKVKFKQANLAHRLKWANPIQ